jgi:hypothetical protein
MKLAFRVGRYISRSLWEMALRPPPSAMVMTVKKVAIPGTLLMLNPQLQITKSQTYQRGQILVDQMQPS